MGSALVRVSSSPGPVGPALEAALVQDTRGIRPVGVRAAGSVERRMVFRATRAQIEIRLPEGTTEEDDRVLVGQYVPLGPDQDGEPRRVRVTLLGEGGRACVTLSGPDGDFTLECDPNRPFWLEFTAGDGPPVRARVSP
jgi:hypothetical protein